MKTRKIVVSEYDSLQTQVIQLGKMGDGKAENGNSILQITFDCSRLATVFGAGVAELLHKRSGDTSPYICLLSQTGNNALWDVTISDTAKSGSGELELRWYVGASIMKTTHYKTITSKALTADAEPPAPIKAWTDKVIAAAHQIAQGGVDNETLNAAIASAIESYMNENDIEGLSEAEVNALITSAIVNLASKGDSYTKAESDAKYAAAGSTSSGGYVAPSGGIPKSDLAQAVQTSLGKADTALQQSTADARYATSNHTHSQYLTEHQSLAGYATEAWVNAKNFLTKTVADGLYALKNHTHSQYLTSHQDISGKANVGDSYTKTESDAKYALKGSTSGTVTEYDDTELRGLIAGKADSNHTHSQYLTEHQSLSGYATEAWVTAKNYVTKAITDGLYALKDHTHSQYLTSHLDVKINGSSVVNGGVANIPLASSDNAGVIKINDTYGLTDWEGSIVGIQASYADYLNADVGYVISKQTLENVITGKGLITEDDVPDGITELTADIRWDITDTTGETWGHGTGLFKLVGTIIVDLTDSDGNSAYKGTLSNPRYILVTKVYKSGTYSEFDFFDLSSGDIYSCCGDSGSGETWSSVSIKANANHTHSQYLTEADLPQGGSGGSAKWKRITNLTLSEQASVVVTKDDNGNSFAVKSVFIALHNGDKSQAMPQLFIGLYNASNIKVTGAYTGTYTNTNTEKWAKFWFTGDGNFIKCDAVAQWYGSLATSNLTTHHSQSEVYYGDDAIITKVGVGTLPAGTEVQIYGLE